MTSDKFGPMATFAKLRPRWCLYPRGLCALCMHRHNEPDLIPAVLPHNHRREDETMPHLNDGAARSLQDMGVDLDKLAAWEQTDEGKAATQRFAEMCERGEIISRPAWATAEIPVQIAEL